MQMTQSKACQPSDGAFATDKSGRTSSSVLQNCCRFCWPFFTVQGRGKARQKRYLCSFTSLLSRTVHLELAVGLDTGAFLNAFYRMVSRRGLPQEVVSDKGRNFVRTEKELRELAKNIDEDNIQRSVAKKGIKWHFNPPLAPRSQWPLGRVTEVYPGEDGRVRVVRFKLDACNTLTRNVSKLCPLEICDQ